jgi:hypothetical protein
MRVFSHPRATIGQYAQLFLHVQVLEEAVAELQRASEESKWSAHRNTQRAVDVERAKGQAMQQSIDDLKCVCDACLGC